jgi:hypothetical protein
MTILAQCKHSDCAGDIYVQDVTKASAIPKAPHHLAIVAECKTCGRLGQYVIERETWDRAKAEFESAVTEPTDLYDQIYKAATIEVNAIESADELLGLWRSYKVPPLRESTMGACSCTDCMRRLYV